MSKGEKINSILVSISPCHYCNILNSCPAKTINFFADAILRLTDPTLREQMGLQAKEAAKKITWQHHGEEIRDIILKHIDFN